MRFWVGIFIGLMFGLMLSDPDFRADVKHGIHVAAEKVERVVS